MDIKRVQSGVLKKSKVSLRNREAVSVPHHPIVPLTDSPRNPNVLYHIIIYPLSIQTVSSKLSLISRVATNPVERTEHPKNKWCKPIQSLDQGLRPFAKAVVIQLINWKPVVKVMSPTRKSPTYSPATSKAYVFRSIQPTWIVTFYSHSYQIFGQLMSSSTISQNHFSIEVNKEVNLSTSLQRCNHHSTYSIATSNETKPLPRPVAPAAPVFGAAGYPATQISMGCWMLQLRDAEKLYLKLNSAFHDPSLLGDHS